MLPSSVFHCRIRYNRSYIVDIFSSNCPEVLSTTKTGVCGNPRLWCIKRCWLLYCYEVLFKNFETWRLGWDSDDFSGNKENEHLRRKSKNDLLKHCLEYFEMVVVSVYEMLKMVYVTTI